MRRSDSLKTRVWLSSSLTFSWYLITPSGEEYRIDGFESEEEAVKSRNAMAMKLAVMGKGTWKEPLPYDRKKTYNRRGPSPSESSFLTDTVMQGDRIFGRKPETIPDVPGRISDRRGGYRT